MNRIKIVKERVCFAIFALGVSLAAMHELGCQASVEQIAKETYANTIKIVKG